MDHNTSYLHGLGLVLSKISLWVCVTGKERQQITESSCFQWFYLHWGFLTLVSSESHHILESIVGKGGTNLSTAILPKF